MTTETKLGLLLGMGVIILVGIFISDHLSKANSQEGTDLARSFDIDEGHLPPTYEESRRRGEDDFLSEAEAEQPLPLPDDFESEPAPEPERSPVTNDRGEAERDRGGREPNILHVDIPRQATALDNREREVIDGEQPLSSDDGEQRRPLPPGFEPAGVEHVTRFAPDDGARQRDEARRQAQQEQERAEEERRQARDSETASNGSSDDASDTVVHYVKENETLSKIAAHYYGNPGYYEVIYEANRNTINNPNFVRPGVRLVIPDEAGSVRRRHGGSASAQPETESSGQSATQTYTVRENDRLWSLAERFYGSGARWKDLLELNKDRIANPDRLTVGDEILVPVQ